MNSTTYKLLWVWVGLVLGSIGCAGYEGAVSKMHESLLSGDKLGALEHANAALEVSADEEYPEKLVGNNSLLLLERAMIKQGLSRYKASSEDFGTADKHLELLDLKNDTMGNIGKFIFSDDAAHYQAPAYEKLLLNTFNMLSYLSVGDMEGARVESRRLRIMQEYLEGEESDQAALADLGAYLAGIAFEAGGRRENALDFYSDALKSRSYESLAEPIRRLSACAQVRDENLDSYIEAHGGPMPQCTPPPEGKGTLIVVSGVGLVPRKTAVRLPVGAAVAIAGAFLMPMTEEQLARFVARGLVTWINFPMMERPQEVYSNASVQVDGVEAPAEVGSDISDKVIAAWDSIKPKLMAAAIVRMVTRLAAGVATEVAVSKASGSAVGGLLAGLAVQGTMTAFDTPDTRSWTTLPSRVYVTRMEVPAGDHEVTVVFSGKGSPQVEKKTVSVPAGGFAVVSSCSMR